MARIGRQIPHFELVDLNSIEAVFSPEKECRYVLSMKFANTLLDQSRDKSLAVIMKNPSAADEQKADATIRKVETFVYHSLSDVRSLHILNIFAFRATEPEDLESAFIDGGAMRVIGEENDHFIKSTIAECDYVILAWGNTSGINKDLYSERIFRLKQILHTIPEHKLFQVSGKKETKHPLHGLMWGYDYKIGPVRNYLLEE
jgi:hypothetical protein